MRTQIELSSIISLKCDFFKAKSTPRDNVKIESSLSRVDSSSSYVIAYSFAFWLLPTHLRHVITSLEAISSNRSRDWSALDSDEVQMCCKSEGEVKCEELQPTTLQRASSRVRMVASILIRWNSSENLHDGCKVANQLTYNLIQLESTVNNRRCRRLSTLFELS